MAYALINQERGLYSARGVRPGDGLARLGGRRADPGDRRTSSPSVVRRDRRPAGRTSLPGQYVTVQVPMPDGVRQPRQYSLTRADDGEHRQFAVKRVRGGGKPDGEVSNLLCDSVGVGDRLDACRCPFGDVVLDDSGRPLVLRQRRHRHHADGRDALAPRRGRLAAADHRAARRRRRGVLRAARAGARRRRGAARTRPRTSGTSAAPSSTLPVDGATPGSMDLDDVDLPRRRRVLPLRPAAVHAGRPQRAHRRGRARRATSSTRCSAPTCGRPTSSPRPRRAPAEHAA